MTARAWPFRAAVLCLALAGCQGAVAPGAVAPGAVHVAPGAVQVGPGEGNAPLVVVQVGPSSRPILEASGDKPLVQVGATSGPAVVVQGTVERGAVQIAGSQSPTSQSAGLSQGGPRTAGGNVKDVQVQVNASGSAWPVLACLAIIGATVLGVAWLRTIRRERRLRGNATAVATAIRDMGGGPQRDRLLGGISARLPAPEAWEGLVRSAGARVRSREKEGRPLPPQ